MAETADLQEIISKNIELIRSLVQDCSTESVVGYSMVKHQQGFPEVELSSPTKQIHFLLGIMLETGEPAAAKEFTDREWEQIVEPLERLGHAYMSLYLPSDEVDGSQPELWGKQQVAMTAFLDYHQKGLLASTEQVSDRIRSYLTPFDDRLSDTLGLSASEALNIAHYIGDKLQQQMDELGQHASSDFTLNEYPEGLVRSVKRLGKIWLTELVERYGDAGKAFWNLFAIRRDESPTMKYPTEQSIVESRPLIRMTDDAAMLFNINILFNAILLVGEETLANDKIRARFFRHRDNTLENQTAEVFQRILGDQVEIYKSVFETPDNQYEHDLVVVSEGIALFVECKASPPSEPFRDPEKAFVRLQRSFRADTGIQKAYDQSLRLFNTVREGELRLFDESGTEVLSLPPSNVIDSYCVCVTRDSFGPIATFLSPMLSKGDDEPYPWVVNIFDLGHIAEAWEYFRWDGRQLKSFLRERILLHETAFADDELDYVGAYIRHCGLHHFTRRDYDLLQLDPRYSLIFDEIYYHIHHGQPRVSINPRHPWQTDVRQSLNTGKQVLAENAPQGRISTGRNEKCPCGSGVKFKRCHDQ